VATYVRKNIWEHETPNAWDPYTIGYAKAAAAMRARASDDPTSWDYQAAMHGSYDEPPPGAVWNQCQHGSWFFLPWHRMYLYFFERIVRAAVVAAGGPEDWALPYWDYSSGAPGNALPPAFREPTWDPGTGPAANPLFTTRRAAKYNAGAALPNSLVSLAALDVVNFSGAPLPGCGGPATGFSHEPQRFGLLENVPHNQVHVQIGGEQVGDCGGGWMVDPNCAAQDPIFWVHHSNIDRLWSKWIGLGQGRSDPHDSAWRSGQRFTFFDENGKEVTMTPADVADTVAQLGYQYDTEAAAAAGRPAAVAAPVPGPPPVAAAAPPLPPPTAAPRMVAASESGVTLTAGRADLAVGLPAPAQDAIARAVDRDDATAQHVYLNVEGLSADRTPGVSWEVYLNLPPGGADEAGEHLVGVISFFGFRRQLDPAGGDHGLGPMIHTFDITDLVAGLKDRRQWDELAARVSFVAVGPHVEDMTATPRVGRVSISFH
jgi:hypothetical protein